MFASFSVQGARKRTYVQMVHDTAEALNLSDDTRKKTFMEFAVQSAREKHELEHSNRELMARLEALEKENQKNVVQTETIVEQVRDITHIHSFDMLCGATTQRRNARRSLWPYQHMECIGRHGYACLGSISNTVLEVMSRTRTRTGC